MAKKTQPIKYINKDFDSIKQDLINYAKVYYPNTYKDFNQASFGALLFDLVAYTGDVLSFYSDYQLNEIFIDTANETKNLLKIAKQMGYKYPGAASSAGTCAFFIKVPAAATGLPNADLVPILKEGAVINSDGGAAYILQEDVNFANSNVKKLNGDIDSNGVPSNYIYKAYGKVVSGKYETELVTIPTYQKFLRLKLEGENITEIISVVDSEGHEFFEVPYLSQNLVYRAVRNRTGSDKETVPYILREMIVPRRFTVEHTIANETFLQFGYGSADTLKSDLFPDPSAAALRLDGKPYYSEDSFDPSVLTKTEKLGANPTSGVLTVIYRKNTSALSNASVDSLSTMTAAQFEFASTDVTSADAATIRASLQVTNEEPILGQSMAPTPDEIRIRAQDSYASQNRAVTKQDYLSIIYRMPAKFGSIKRANIIQDKNSFKRNLNLYVISEDIDRKLTTATSTLKENLKTWLGQYKMINDTVDILDGKIANFGIEFEVIGALHKSRSEILTKAVTAVKREILKNNLNFGEPFYVSEIYKILNELPEVVDAVSVKIINKTGDAYSTAGYDIEANITKDGRFVKIPENVILELRFPEQDIVGVVK